MTLGKPRKIPAKRNKSKYVMLIGVFVIALVLSFGLLSTTYYSDSSYEGRGRNNFLSSLSNWFGWWRKPKPPTTPTPLPVPPQPVPTPTPSPTPVPVPTPTPTPIPPPSTNPGPIQIANKAEVGVDLNRLNQQITDANKGVYDRECTDAEHDSTRWHGLVNEQARCHYDHQHFDDPNYVNDIFGTPGVWFGKDGQSISYPWQTFPATSPNEGNEVFTKALKMENDTKHEGYSWIVRRDQNCSGGDCVRDYRLQIHFDGNMHAATRYHSFSFEGRFCTNGSDLSTCGIVRYAGWMDYGRLVTSATPNDTNCSNGNKNFIPLPADNLFFPIDRPDARDEVRCHPFLTALPAKTGERSLAEWWGHAGGETRIQVKSYDPIGNVDPSNPTEFQTFCKETDPDCEYNQSILTAVMAYTEHIHADANGIPMDSDGNGRTDLRAYFNRWGAVNRNCSAPGLDCIPFEYSNVPFNQDFNNDGRPEEARYVQNICDDCQRVDYDIAPAGKQWITWFYKHLNMDMAM